MNSEKRSTLKSAMNLLEKVIALVDRVCDQEQDAIDNYPENLQSTAIYESMEIAADNLNEALEKLEESKELIGSAAV